MAHDCLSAAYALSLLQAGDAALRTRIQQEKEQRTHEIAEQAATAHACHDSRMLHKCVRELAPRPPLKPKMVKDASGIPIATPEAVAERWRQHFAGKLAGFN